MRIAIASSGLGHVARGIETWALDTARALHEHGVGVTLFAAGAVEMRNAECGMRNGELGVPHSAFGISHGESRLTGDLLRASPAVVVLACLRRGRRAARVLARMTPGFLWRWGLKSAYGWEQATFWLRLAPALRRGGFDILHVQDPMLAYWCRAWRRRGWLTTREILAHGTEEPLEFLDKFEYVQHLAPWHLIESRKQKAESGNGEGEGEKSRKQKAESGNDA